MKKHGKQKPGDFRKSPKLNMSLSMQETTFILNVDEESGGIQIDLTGSGRMSLTEAELLAASMRMLRDVAAQYNNLLAPMALRGASCVDDYEDDE